VLALGAAGASIRARRAGCARGGGRAGVDRDVHGMPGCCPPRWLRGRSSVRGQARLHGRGEACDRPRDGAPVPANCCTVPSCWKPDLRRSRCRGSSSRTRKPPRRSSAGSTDSACGPVGRSRVPGSSSCVGRWRNVRTVPARSTTFANGGHRDERGRDRGLRSGSAKRVRAGRRVRRRRRGRGGDRTRSSSRGGRRVSRPRRWLRRQG
jgi:hypothetical protein